VEALPYLRLPCDLLPSQKAASCPLLLPSPWTPDPCHKALSYPFFPSTRALRTPCLLTKPRAASTSLFHPCPW
jgi:hypothetical protein